MSDHRQLKKQTVALLSELGTGPDQVAESLQAAGVHGIPKDSRSCAVALYLRASMGADPRIRSVRVGPCSLLIDVASTPELRPAGRLSVQLPKPVRQFVAAFDARRYPTIIRPKPVAAPSSVVGAG